MVKKLIPMNLQLFGEGDPPQTPPAQEQPAAAQIDYSKLESILDKKLGVTETGVMKSFFKQQGLTEDEAKQAMDDFKTAKAAEQGNASEELTQAQLQLQQAQTQLQQAAVEREAFTLSAELGIDPKTLPYVIKLADFKAVMDDKGNVKKDLVKSAMDQVLKDVPGLKTQGDDHPGGFKIGGDGGQQGSVQNEQLANIFGNK